MTLQAIDGRALLIAIAASIAFTIWARSVLSQATRERDTTTSLLAPPKPKPQPEPQPQRRWIHFHFVCSVCRHELCVSTTSPDAARDVLAAGTCAACTAVLHGLESELTP